MSKCRVPHDTAFRDALLAKPGVQKAFDALEVEYTALHTMLEPVKELTVIKLLDVKPLKAHTLALSFSDDSQGVFDGAAYLATRQGPLLEPLHDPAYFNRCFVDAGALCWPNGLELSAARLHGLVNAAQTA